MTDSPTSGDSIDHLDFGPACQNPSCPYGRPESAFLATIRQPCRHNDDLYVCAACKIAVASCGQAQQWICQECELVYITQTADLITFDLLDTARRKDTPTS